MTKITPHKGDESGGRTERFEGRCTKRIKQMADDVKQKTGLSDADLFELIVIQKHQDEFGNED